MEIDRKELKQRAKEAMGLTRPRFWVVTLVYVLLTSGVSLAVNSIPLPVDSRTGSSSIALFAHIFIILYSIVIKFGYNLWALWSCRRLDPGMGSLIQGFSITGRVILMRLSIFLRTLGWVFFVACAGMLATLLSYVLPILTPICIALMPLATWAITLRYALAPYLLADHPDDGANTAVQRSVNLMAGWKWELFKLEFSFLGWELINFLLHSLVLSFFLWQNGFFEMLVSSSFDQILASYISIANSPLVFLLCELVTLPLSLWLTPYRSVAQAGFYDARRQLQQESAPPLLPFE